MWVWVQCGHCLGEFETWVDREVAERYDPTFENIVVERVYCSKSGKMEDALIIRLSSSQA